MKQIKITILTSIKSQPIQNGFEISKRHYHLISWPKESHLLEILADNCITGDRWFLEIMEVPAQSQEVVEKLCGSKWLQGRSKGFPFLTR